MGKVKTGKAFRVVLSIALAIFTLIWASLLTFLVAACLDDDGTQTGGGSKKTGVLDSIQLPDTVPQADGEFVQYEKFIKQAENNQSNLEGIIVCPLYEVTVTTADGEKTPVYSYSVPMVQSEVHSFGYIDATADTFPLTVTIKSIKAGYSLNDAVVIPEKLGVVPTVQNGTVTFTVESFDYYNVLFNGKFNFERPYTLYVREYQELEVPKGYNLIEFKPGVHYVDYVSIPSNTMVYLHTGALLIAKQPNIYEEGSTGVSHLGNRTWRAFFSWNKEGEKAENIIIRGHGVIDFSGLDLHARTPFSFSSCTNLTIDGVTIVNSISWTLHLKDCLNVNVRNVILLGYRINSDGIAVCNCKNVLVENCWLRTGDDMFEVKATDSGASTTNTGGENITFRHCQAFAEKTRSFGFIQESQMPVSNILFEDCSSLMQTATWNEAMGAFNVIVGDSSTVSNVVFRNCDSYYALGYVLNVAVGFNQWTTNQNAGVADLGTIHDVTFENFKYYSHGAMPDGSEWKTRGIQIRNQGYDGFESIFGTEANLYNITYRNVARDGVVLSQADLSNKEVFSIAGVYENVVIEGAKTE
ncbi:MAG: hypothetical protein IJ506_05645 [Clostridia bacterium]|nr:hypothetical protein [Clostridia bacterium]